MTSRQSDWSIEETTIALSLYAVTFSSQIHVRNPQIIALSSMLRRSPGSVKCKLFNLASFDDKARGQNLNHASQNDHTVWNRYFDGRELKLLPLMREAVDLCKKFNWDISRADWLDPLDNDSCIPLSSSTRPTLRDYTIDSKVPNEIQVLQNQRCMQGLFRNAVLANFNGACAITGCSIKCLVEAAHILPWSTHPSERLKQSNGLALTPFLHTAYDEDYLGIDPDGKVFVSAKLLSQKKMNEKFYQYLTDIDGMKIDFSKLRVPPDKDYLAKRFQNYRLHQ